MDALLNLLYLVFFYGLIISFVLPFFEMQIVILLIITTGVSFFLFFVRRLVKFTSVMLIAHLLIPVGAAWIYSSNLFYLLAYMAMSVTLTIFSLYQRYKKSNTFTPEFTFFAPLVLIVGALVAGHFGHTNMYIPYAVMIVFLGIGSRLHTRMSLVNSSLEAITQNSTQPVQKILAFDYKAMAVLTAVMVGMILFLNRFLLRPILQFIAQLSLNIDFDLGFDPLMEGYHQEPGVELHGENPFLDMMEGANNEPALFWRILEFFTFYVVLPLIGLMMIIALFRFTIKIYYEWGLKKERDQDLANGFADIKEFISSPKIKSLWRRSNKNEHRLRRLFRETIIKHMKKGVPISKSDTPMEMVTKIHKEDIGALAEEYGAVRYSSN